LLLLLLLLLRVRGSHRKGRGGRGGEEEGLLLPAVVAAKNVTGSPRGKELLLLLLLLLLERKSSGARPGHLGALAPLSNPPTRGGGGGGGGGEICRARSHANVVAVLAHRPEVFLHHPGAHLLLLLEVFLGMRPHLLRTPRAQQAGNVLPGPAMLLVPLQKQSVLLLGPAAFSAMLAQRRCRCPSRHRLLLLLLGGGPEGRWRRSTCPSQSHG